MKSPLLAWGWKMGAEAGSNLSWVGLKCSPPFAASHPHSFSLPFIVSSSSCFPLPLSITATCPFHFPRHQPNVTLHLPPVLSLKHTYTDTLSFHFLWKPLLSPSLSRLVSSALSLSHNISTRCCLLIALGSRVHKGWGSVQPVNMLLITTISSQSDAGNICWPLGLVTWLRNWRPSYFVLQQQ